MAADTAKQRFLEKKKAAVRLAQERKQQPKSKLQSRLAKRPNASADTKPLKAALLGHTSRLEHQPAPASTNIPGAVQRINSVAMTSSLTPSAASTNLKQRDGSNERQHSLEHEASNHLHSPETDAHWQATTDAAYGYSNDDIDDLFSTYSENKSTPATTLDLSDFANNAPRSDIPAGTDTSKRSDSLDWLAGAVAIHSPHVIPAAPTINKAFPFVRRQQDVLPSGFLKAYGEIAAQLDEPLGHFKVDLSERAAQRTRSKGNQGMVENGVALFDTEALNFETLTGREVVAHELVHLAQLRVPALDGMSPFAAEYEAQSLAPALAKGEHVAPPVHALAPNHLAGNLGKASAVDAVLAKPMRGRISYTIHNGDVRFYARKKTKLVQGVDRVLQVLAGMIRAMAPKQYTPELVKSCFDWLKTTRGDDPNLYAYGPAARGEKPPPIRSSKMVILWLEKQGIKIKMGKISRKRWEHGISMESTIRGLKKRNYLWAYHTPKFNPKKEEPKAYLPDWWSDGLLRYYTWYDGGPHRRLVTAAKKAVDAGGVSAPDSVKMKWAKAIRRFIDYITVPMTILDLMRDQLGSDPEIRWLFRLKPNGTNIPGARKPRSHATAKVLKFIRRHYKEGVGANKTYDPDPIIEAIKEIRSGPKKSDKKKKQTGGGGTGSDQTERSGNNSTPEDPKLKSSHAAIRLSPDLTRNEIAEAQKFLDRYFPSTKPNSENKKPKPTPDRTVTRAILKVWLKIMAHPMADEYFRSRTPTADGTAEDPTWTISFFESEFERLRIMDAQKRGVFEKTMDGKKSKPRFNTPVEGFIKTNSGLLMPGKEAQFAFRMTSRNAIQVTNWPFARGKITTRWAVYKKESKESTKNPEDVTRQTVVYFDTGPPKNFIHTFKSTGDYVVELIAYHNYYKPKLFTETIRVQSVDDWLKEQEYDAYGGMMPKKGDRIDPGYARSRFFMAGREIEYDPKDTERVRTLLASPYIQHLLVWEGQTAPGYKHRTHKQRVRPLELNVRELNKIVRANQGSKLSSKQQLAKSAAKLANQYTGLLNRLDRVKKSSKGHTFDVRATYVSRQQNLSGPLLLFGECIETDSGVKVTLHDTTQRWESKFYRFTGEGKTFFQAWQIAISKMFKSYPPGKMSVYTEDPLAKEIKVPRQRRKARKTYLIRGVTTGKEVDDNEEMYVGIGAALLMLIPGVGTYIFMAYLAYRLHKTMDKLADESRKGVLSVESGSIIVGDLLLDAIPAIGRAKLIKMGASQRSLYLLTGLEGVGDALLITADAKHQIEGIRGKLTGEYAQVQAEIKQLQQTSPSSTKIRELRKRLRTLESEIQGATKTVLAQVAKGRAIAMAPRTVMAGIQLKTKTKPQLDAEDRIANRLSGGPQKPPEAEGHPRTGTDATARPATGPAKTPESAPPAHKPKRPQTEGKVRVKNGVRMDDQGRALVTQDNIRAFENKPPNKEDGTASWVLYDDGTALPFCHIHVDQKGSGPEMTLNPKNPNIFRRYFQGANVGRQQVDAPNGLRSDGFSWTRASLERAIALYRRTFGKKPPNLPGQIAWKNMDNFQEEFAKIATAKPNLSAIEVANEAILKISFGKHRKALGYGDIKVEIHGPLVLKEMADGKVHNVPDWISIDARPVKVSAASTTKTKPVDGGNRANNRRREVDTKRSIPEHSSSRLGEPSAADLRRIRRKYPGADIVSERRAVWLVEQQRSTQNIVAGERECAKALGVPARTKMVDLLKTTRSGKKVPIEVKNQRTVHLSGHGNAALAKFRNIAKHANMAEISHFEVICHSKSKLQRGFRVSREGVLEEMVSGTDKWKTVLIGGKQVHMRRGQLGRISRD